MPKKLYYKLLKCKFPKKRHLLHAFCPNPVRFVPPLWWYVHHGTSLRRMNESSHSTGAVVH